MGASRFVPLTIIIPARGEEGSIAATLSQLVRLVAVPNEILVVDDSIDPADKTADVVAAYAEKHSAVSVIRKKSGDRDGFAAALLRGVARAKGEAVVFVMADSCDDPKTINMMYDRFRQGWDVVCGSRYIAGGKKLGGLPVQDFGSRLINTTLFYLGFPTSDATNSFKLYRRSLLVTLSPVPFVSTECSLWLVLQAYWRGRRIMDVATTWLGRTIGKAKIAFWKRSIRYFLLFAIALPACGLVTLRRTMRVTSH